MPAIYQIFQGAPNKKTKTYFRNKQKIASRQPLVIFAPKIQPIYKNHIESLAEI